MSDKYVYWRELGDMFKAYTAPKLMRVLDANGIPYRMDAKNKPMVERVHVDLLPIPLAQLKQWTIWTPQLASFLPPSQLRQNEEGSGRLLSDSPNGYRLLSSFQLSRSISWWAMFPKS